MTANEALLARIVVDPAICFGKPTIKGHRIWVSLILDLIAVGATVGQVIEEYPQLTEDDVRACIASGAQLAKSDSWTSTTSRDVQARRESRSDGSPSPS